MHGYSTDSDERRVVPLFLALVAVSLAWLSSKFLAVIHLERFRVQIGTRQDPESCWMLARLPYLFF